MLGWERRHPHHTVVFFAEEKYSPVLWGCSEKLKPSLDYGVVQAAVMGAGQLLFPTKLR